MTERPARSFEGSVMADAVLVDAGLSGPHLATRVLHASRTGDRLLRLGDDVLLVFAEPRRLRVELCPGTPLAKRCGQLVGFDGGDEEAASAPRGSVLRLVAGRVDRIDLGSLAALDAADLIDAGVVRVHAVRSLGSPPPIPRMPEEAAPTPSLRALMNVPAADEQGPMFASLTSPAPLGLGARLVRWMRWLLGSRPGARARRGSGSGWFARLLARLLPPPRTESAPASTSVARRSWLADLARRLFTPISRWLVLLERLTGRQARYLADLLSDLDRGDDERVLRRAIPLGADAAGAQTPIALGVPSPRAELVIAPRASGPGSTIPIDAEVQSLLRDGYELTFRRLDAAGRHADAAFVLAELLRDHARAVDYLEGTGALKLAAEVAEARGMPPDRVVSLWFRAGDRERAVAIARRTGAFVAAIERLERGRHPEAAALRLEYADLLARAGDFVRAADVVWTIPEARWLARSWLERAIDAGGLGAARGWARLLAIASLDVRERETVREKLVPLLRDDGIDAALFRAEFGRHAAQENLAPFARSLAKLAYRGLLRDRLEHGLTVDAILRSLQTRIADPVLTADLPQLSPVASTVVPTGPRRFEAYEVGALPIRDALALPDGRYLVALGELGVRIVGRTGRTELRFDLPAEHLVLDERAERAIVVAARGGVMRLSRIDLTTRRAGPWFDFACDVVAGAFDGFGLLVGRSLGETGELLCLDALADEPIVLHTVRGLEGAVLDIELTPQAHRVRLRGDSSETSEILVFERPSRTLRVRRIVPHAEQAGFGEAFPDRDACGRGLVFELGLRDGQPICLRCRETSTGLVVESGARGTAGSMTEVLDLVGAARARARRSADAITVSDDQGRIIVLDATTFALRSCLFLQP